MSYVHGAYSLEMNLITGGAVVVVGPLSVTEGNSGETVLELYIQLDPDIVILNRDVAYTIVLTDGTAEGQLIVCGSGLAQLNAGI